MHPEDYELHEKLIRGLQLCIEAYKAWLKRKKEQIT
jgi:hypothetical protein